MSQAMSTGTWQPTYYVQPSVSGWGEGRGNGGKGGNVYRTLATHIFYIGLCRWVGEGGFEREQKQKPLFPEGGCACNVVSGLAVFKLHRRH